MPAPRAAQPSLPRPAMEDPRAATVRSATDATEVGAVRAAPPQATEAVLSVPAAAPCCPPVKQLIPRAKV